MDSFSAIEIDKVKAWDFRLTNKNTSECFLSIFIDGINKGDFPLSINTDEDYQYNFIINNSMDLQEI